MNRRMFLMGVAGAAGCSSRSRVRLNVFNWSNYTAPDTIPSFEREFGVRIRYAIYESNEEMLAKVMSGNSGWDVVFPTHYYLGPMREHGLVAPLRHDRLRNLNRLDARFRAPGWDTGLDWCVPYMWGATGIVYNRRFVSPPRSWVALWDESLRGRMTMLDDPAEVLGAALKKLGYSLNSTDARELGEAQREAIAQKRLLRAYLNAEVRDQLVAGDVLAAQLFATTGQQAIDASADLGFAYPEEGFALWADNGVILRESRHKELAHEFLDYLLRPRVAADVVRACKTATCNGAAHGLLEPALRDNATLYPTAEILRRGEWFATLPAWAQRLRDRLWTEIKAA